MNKIHFLVSIFVVLLAGSTHAQTALTNTTPKNDAATTNGPRREIRSPVQMTPEQRAKVDEANAEFRQASAPINEKMRDARRELELAINAEPLDEAGVRAKAKALGDLEADMAVLRAKRVAKLRESVGPELARRLAPSAAALSRANQPMPEAPTRPGARVVPQPVNQ